MIQFVIAGLVLGGIYAILSAGLVVTYRSSGVLNFSFGALAYFVGRFYYFLNTQHGWSTWAAGALSLAVLAPGLGLLLYLGLFRLLRTSTTVIKLVATIGLSVSLPPLAQLMFGNVTIIESPGLAPLPVRVYHVLGVPITLDQVIVYLSVVAVGVAGTVVLRYTDIGLRVRAMVDSPAMTSLSGTNPTTVAAGVWVISTFLAGLAGVLSAPVIGLNSGNYALLMVAAFAAVVAAKLRSIPIAVTVSFGMGVAGAVLQYALPPSSTLSSDLITSIPFLVMVAFILYSTIRWGGADEARGVGGALDRAILPHGGDRLAAAGRVTGRQSIFSDWRSLCWVLLIACLPIWLHGLWIGLLAQGAALAVIFLSMTLVTGEGGMIWLCQATFAGVGAVTAAQLATVYHWPVLAAIGAGGLLAASMGVLIGLLTIRMGSLYIALITLSFGLLMDNIVFTANRFVNYGIGVTLNPPSFASSNLRFFVFCLLIFCLLGLIIFNLKRSTTGLALTAIRWSERGSMTIGLSALQMKVIVAGLAAFVAGVGGGLLAAETSSAVPANFATLTGVVWLAVLVTTGAQSITAALVAGVSLTLFTGVMVVYFPTSWGQVPTITFGIGAAVVAQNPEGYLAQNARYLRSLWHWLRSWGLHRPKDLAGTTEETAQESRVLS